MSADHNDALRRECEALAAEYRAPLPAGDEGLIAAVRRWHELERRNRFSVSVELDDAIVAPIATAAAVELQERIEEWAPQGLRGASAKVRYCIDAGLECEDVAEQLLAVIERDAAEAAARGPFILTRAGAELAYDLAHQTADPFAFAGVDDDPVVVLGAERDAVAAALNRDLTDDLAERVVALDDRIADLVPRSAAGAVVQLEILREYLRDFEWGEYAEQFCGKIIAGLGSLGGAAPDDSAILALFHDWLAAHAAQAAIAATATDAEHGAKCEILWQIERRIYDAPVAGPVGMAIKAYMVARYGEDTFAGPDGLTLVACDRSASGLDMQAVRGLLASSAAFLPELAPLVADVVALPSTRP